MGTVTIAEMLAIEASALANGWTEQQLVNLAGERLGSALGRHFPKPGTVVGYLGKGHNAADALVALRILRDKFGWKIATRNAYPVEKCAPLVLKKWAELDLRQSLDRSPRWWDIEGPLVLLDGLLGSGSKGSLREPLLQLAEEMAWLRQNTGASVAAVDMPSGIDPDSGKSSPGAIVADVTFMIGAAKQGLLAGHAASAVGALALVPVEPLTPSPATDRALISPQTFDFGKSPRSFDFHKGMAGRIAILAGSTNYTGAPVLAATGALRAGAGLITLFVPESILATVSSRCPPEIIVRGIRDPRELLAFRFDALVAGCGLGETTPPFSEGLLDLIASSPAPAVIDADALNLISKSGKLDILSAKHVITPHPGEFARLAPDLTDSSREESTRCFTDRTPATLLLKGSRTIVTSKGHPLWINSTGTPGMATGGQGDLLAGVIGARLAAGDQPTEAAALGAWLCGRAAEIALGEPFLSEESLTPSDVSRYLGAAFRDWKKSHR